MYNAGKIEYVTNYYVFLLMLGGTSLVYVFWLQEYSAKEKETVAVGIILISGRGKRILYSAIARLGRSTTTLF